MKHTLSLQLVFLIGCVVIGCDRHRPHGTRGASTPGNASAWSAADIAAAPTEFLAAAERQVAAAVATGEQRVQALERHRTELADKLTALRGSAVPGQTNPLEQDYALAIEQTAAALEHARASLAGLKSRHEQLVIGRERVQLNVHEEDIFNAVELATSALILADREFPAGSVAAPAAPAAPVAAPPVIAQGSGNSDPRPAGAYVPIPYASNPANASDRALNQTISAIDAAIREKRFDDALEQCRRAESLRPGAAHAGAARGRTLDAIYDEAHRLESRGGSAAAVVQLYRKAAENNHAASQLNLGNIYREGRIVAKNPAEALKWYRLAATQGYDKAQANLGMMLYERGTPQERGEGIKWLQQAARNGNAGAQGALNQLHVKW